MQHMADLTEGARLLRQAIKPTPKMTPSALSKALGVSTQAIYAWLSGKATPDPKHWKPLQELLGIPVTVWLDDARQEPPPPSA